MATPSDPPLLAKVEDDDLLDAWAEFLGGDWTLEPPTEPGIYPIAARDGGLAGHRRFVTRDGELVDTLTAHGEPGWRGFFWSTRLPPPPKPTPNMEE